MNPNLPALRAKTRELTTSPGVYLMRDKTGKVIYVGKAKNLRNRVTSYFRENSSDPLLPHAELLPKVYKMVSQVQNYDFIVTDTEYEALVLECSLIKQYNPKYNILLKDDKGYHYIRISGGAWPRITAEKQDTTQKGDVLLGPYISGYTVTQAVEEVNRVFQLPTCQKKFPNDLGKGRPCLNYHIKKCMGVCRGRISEEEYGRIVKEAVLYIRQGSADSVKQMTSAMEAAAEAMDFERAALLRDRIAAIQRAADTQKIIMNDMKNADVIATARNGDHVAAAVLIYRNGRLHDKVVYFLGENDDALLEDFLTQYYSQEMNYGYPKAILLERELDNDTMELLERLLRERVTHQIPISVPKRGDNLSLIQMAKNNASEYLSFKVGRTGKEIVALEELGKILGLEEPPQYIEAYDISNLASQSMVAGMVVFENGRPLKKAYKRFSIKNVAIQNDLACMREVLERRFLRYLESNSSLENALSSKKEPVSDDTEESEEGFARLPDLILLDGGQGQVNAVTPILRQMGILVPVFGMVKDNKHRTRAIAAAGEEITISDKKQAFFLLTRIQDEVHRFAITYQRQKHQKQSFALELTNIYGIGNKKALKLIQTFKTREALLNASPEELARVAKVSRRLGEDIYVYLHKNFCDADSV